MATCGLPSLSNATPWLTAGQASFPCVGVRKHPWAKHVLINAKAETVQSLKTFKPAFYMRRCVLPCSGWYEWRQEATEGPKQRYYFTGPEEHLLMAGIWWPPSEERPGGALVTLTQPANAGCVPYHERMPVIL